MTHGGRRKGAGRKRGAPNKTTAEVRELARASADRVLDKIEELAFDAAADGERARWTGHAQRLRLATSGSAALPVTIAERWRALSGAIPLERYGMTEIGVGITNRLG